MFHIVWRSLALLPSESVCNSSRCADGKVSIGGAELGAVDEDGIAGMEFGVCEQLQSRQILVIVDNNINDSRQRPKPYHHSLAD